MRGKHGMVSFQRPEQIEAAAEICQSIVLDNGAFTAWRKGEKHDFDGYREWAANWLKHPAVDWCLIPDVIDGDEAANDTLLIDWDLHPALSVPVYHLHESLDRLERLVITYPRVALGSSGIYRDAGSNTWWGRMAEIMRAACDENGMPRCKLHGLRMLDPVLFSHPPLSSADSCNVALNIGIDSRWMGPYMPMSKEVRAIVMMDRVESHASARRWSNQSAGVQQNMELLG
jgi:hypothetical protein